MSMVLFFGMLSTFSFAQPISSNDISWGSSIQIKSNESYPQEVLQTSNASYLITRSGMLSSYSVSIFDLSDLKFQGQFDLKFKLDKSLLSVEGQIIFADTLYFITSQIDREAKLKKFYTQKFEESGKLGLPKLITSVKYSSVKNASASKNGREIMLTRTTSFKIAKSPDSKCLAFLFPTDFDGYEYENNQWNVVIYDSQFSISEKISFTITEANMLPSEFLLSNGRQVYMLGIQNFKCLKQSAYLTGSDAFESFYPVGDNYFLLNHPVYSRERKLITICPSTFTKKDNSMFKGKSIYDFRAEFRSSDDCKRYLFELKWGDGYKCSKCGHEKSYTGRTKWYLKCANCAYDESVTANTLFHKMKVPILKAFEVLFMLSVRKKGMSSLEIGRTYGLNHYHPKVFRKQ